MLPRQSCAEDEGGIVEAARGEVEEEAEGEAHYLEPPCRHCPQLLRHRHPQAEVVAEEEEVVQGGEAAEVAGSLWLKASRFTKSAPTATTICLTMPRALL